MKLIPLLILFSFSFFPKASLTQKDFRKGFVVNVNREKKDDSLRFSKGRLIGKSQKIYHSTRGSLTGCLTKKKITSEEG